MCDSDDNWSDVEDELEEDQKCLCPFCDEVQPSVDDTFSHCSSKHALNLLQYKQTLCMLVKCSLYMGFVASGGRYLESIIIQIELSISFSN